MLQRACDDPALKGWLSSDQHTATMGTPEVQAVSILLYAFRDEVSRVTGVRMPSGLDPQCPYGQADTKASLSQVLTDQQALSWPARDLWRWHAEGAGLPFTLASNLPHLCLCSASLFWPAGGHAFAVRRCLHVFDASEG